MRDRTFEAEERCGLGRWDFEGAEEPSGRNKWSGHQARTAFTPETVRYFREALSKCLHQLSLQCMSNSCGLSSIDR